MTEETASPSAETPSPSVSPSPGPSDEDAIPPEVADNAEAWPLPNKDYESTRATTDAEIDSSNVNDLGVAWSFALPGMSQYGAAAAVPIVADGVVYYQDLRSNVFAFDLESGELLWQRMYDEFSLGPNGPAVGYGKVFVVSSVTSVTALDAETGEEVWTRELDLRDTEGMDIQPLVYDGMVYISTVPGRDVEQFYSGNATGVIYALDQETGETVWSFDTVDSEDIWGNPEVNSGGGAWFPPSVDQERGLTFWGVGNPAPWPGTEEFPNGSSRPGPNLYTNSIIALDHKTGEMKWFHQVLPHDLFDHDFQNSPVITSATVSGQEHDLAIGSGKDGSVIAFDRDTGEIVWETPVGRHQNDMLEAVPEGEEIEVLPGYFGGVETPIAYADGVVYVPVVDLPATFTSTERQRADFSTGTGQLVAISVETGKIRWQIDLPQMPLGGATVVNDLIFTGTYDGVIYAFDRETGEQVWTFELPAGINAQPAVVGDTIIWGAGVPPEDGSQPPVLVAFRIGEDNEIVTEPAPAAEGTPTGTPGAEGTPSPTGTVTGTPEGTVTGTPEGTATPAPTGTPEGTPEATATAMPTGTAAPEATATMAPEPAGTPEATPTEPTGGGAVNLSLSADNIQFSTDTLTAPAGADVTLEFTNEEAVPHNFALYDSPSMGEELFSGDIITGPDATTTYEFTAPETPGEYYFLCEIHPAQMNGTFVAE